LSIDDAFEHVTSFCFCCCCRWEWWCYQNRYCKL